MGRVPSTGDDIWVWGNPASATPDSAGRGEELELERTGPAAEGPKGGGSAEKWWEMGEKAIIPLPPPHTKRRASACCAEISLGKKNDGGKGSCGSDPVQKLMPPTPPTGRGEGRVAVFWSQSV